MARMGDGYGSEYHLLRFLEFHRDYLSDRVKHVTGAQSIDWENHRLSEGEWKRLDFLSRDSMARKMWKEFWPTKGMPHNWDAIGRVVVEGKREWLLVEAKAHPGELKKRCTASEGGGRPKIREALNQTKRDLGLQNGSDWLGDYYQHANRLAALNFMIQNGEPGRLLFVYFCGDKVPGKKCPEDEGRWSVALAQQDKHLGLSNGHALTDRVHKIFVPVID